MRSNAGMDLDAIHDRETDRVRAIYDRAAARVDRSRGSWFLEDGRAWLCAGATGDTLEVGIGSGRGVALYPPGVRLVAIELSPAMLGLARRRAAVLGLTVDLRLGDAQRLPFDDASFDTVVFSLVLCTIPDPDPAMREAARVLRPGGSVRALEHVRSPNGLVRLVERLLEPLAARFGADHLLREPAELARSAGLVVTSIERRRLGVMERLVATKTAPPEPGRDGLRGPP